MAHQQREKAKEEMDGAEAKLDAKKEKVKESKDEETVKPSDVAASNEGTGKKESPAKVVAKAEAKKKKKVVKAENEKREATKEVIAAIEETKKANN